ncbi:MAG: hypothetical protein JXM74_06715 [Fusobacteriaceae bacterium]|nr:hypothetical protein [Fusobacteriaceae bacterium]MBN2838433.1 hypothetical protein [Fusobacteriaceae bacterium]
MKKMILILCFILFGLSSFGANVKMKSTENSINYGGKNIGKTTFLVKGDKLELKFEELDVEEGNFPVKITMKIKKSTITIKNIWNDGIYVRVADFDKNDKFMDVYVTETGTDIGAYTTIYRYDGQKLYKYKGFSHYLSDFLYDGKGNIYFDDSEAAEGILGSYKTKFNYKTGKIEGKK